jgi:hypothetical protein
MGSRNRFLGKYGLRWCPTVKIARRIRRAEEEISGHEHGNDVSKLARGLRLIHAVSLVLNKLGLPYEEYLSERVKKLAEIL